jgi:ribosome modulation factor
LGQRAAESGVRLHFIYLDKPMQNAYVESLSGKSRDECQSQHRFISLEETRSVSEE